MSLRFYEQLPELSFDTFSQLRGLVRSRGGLNYDDGSRVLFQRRMAPRLRELQLTSFDEYLKFVLRDSRELEQIFEILTTKETYFFRQEYQLRAFADELLPRLVQAAGGQSRLTFWSAGCSSGEEAYTIAMLAHESPFLRGFRVRVLGTDLCPSNVETANRGIYRSSSFRTMTQEQIRAHFTEVDGGLRVGDHLRRLVHFSTGNLMRGGDVRSVGRVDVVFCRNVLIYFDEVSRKKATNAFFERLLPGGYLLLGHSESLLNADTQFEPVHLEGDLVYQRPPLDRTSSTKLRSLS